MGGEGASFARPTQSGTGHLQPRSQLRQHLGGRGANPEHPRPIAGGKDPHPGKRHGRSRSPRSNQPSHLNQGGNPLVGNLTQEFDRHMPIRLRLNPAQARHPPQRSSQPPQGIQGRNRTPKKQPRHHSNSRANKETHPSPLSRETHPAEHNQHSRGGGAGGGGTSSCRTAKSHRHTHPAKPNSCVSQANVWREPHGGRVASAPAGRTRRGSPVTAKQNHRNIRQNDPFASQLRRARVHQPADADRSPANTRALPKPAISRTQTTLPRQSFVNRPNRSIAAGTTWSTALPPSSHAATAERAPNRPAPAHKRL
jgi:hypothetical protein